MDNNIAKKFDEIKLFVFDMAGTTVNENNLVYQTVADAINQVISDNEDFDNHKVTLATCLEIGAGKEKKQAIQDILQQHCERNTKQVNLAPLVDEAFELFKLSLKDAYNSDTVKSFDGMQELFVALKNNGKSIVLNTGYDKATAQKILDLLNWQVGREIDLLVTADDVENGRPAPDMINKAMTHFNVADSLVVLKAGDSTIDIEEGKNANCGLTIGVLTGAQTKEQLETANPNVILDKLTELKNYIVLK